MHKILASLYFASLRLIGKAYDLYYKIRTESVEPFRLWAACSDGGRYEPTPYWLLPKIIDKLNPLPDDVVFDLGCGKGRFVAYISRYRVRQIVGVEIDQTLAAIAIENTNRVRGRRSPVQILNENVINTDIDSGTLFFMFNPFGAETLGLVLSRIWESVLARPRRVRIAYYHPKFKYLFDASRWLECSIWEKHFWLRRTQRVLFATSKMPGGTNPPELNGCQA
jgi:SAM-dependent methyltransferase